MRAPVQYCARNPAMAQEQIHAIVTDEKIPDGCGFQPVQSASGSLGSWYLTPTSTG
jgi:hypothetical protein